MNSIRRIYFNANLIRNFSAMRSVCALNAVETKKSTWTTNKVCVCQCYRDKYLHSKEQIRGNISNECAKFVNRLRLKLHKFIFISFSPTNHLTFLCNRAIERWYLVYYNLFNVRLSQCVHMWNVKASLWVLSVLVGKKLHQITMLESIKSRLVCDRLSFTSVQ